jgi:hypothetical protein
MKRDTSKLNGRDIAGIRKWLRADRSDRRYYCPFRWRDHCFKSGDLSSKCSATCWRMFPSLDRPGHCPCHMFELPYVTRVARRVVGEWEDRERE